jgi:hypothetical protein
MEHEIEIKMILKERLEQSLNQIREQNLGGQFFISPKTVDLMVESSFSVLKIQHDLQEFLYREGYEIK